MKKVLILLTLLVTTASCSVEDICRVGGDCFYKNNLKGDTPRDYAQMFLLDMRRQGITEDRFPETWRRGREARELIRFGDTEGHAGVTAVDCDRITNQAYPVDIRISKGWWDFYNDGYRIQLIYHEMGHYVFGMAHNNNPRSIMYGGAVASSTEVTVNGLLHGIYSIFRSYKNSSNYATLCENKSTAKGGSVQYTCDHFGQFEDDIFN